MEHFEVASLDEGTLQRIMEFERDLQAATGRDVALVAYAADDGNPAKEQAGKRLSRRT